ncbi:hypothetical protein DDE83_004398 [Stemphylium lycopersici]|uniref:Nucleoside-triphosphate phosphatase n=1 Tax=Stemphylium lycopersici TaxID=183478 RepID=A0A364N4T4_STELY|nr:hypothetical protein DDE83_004398 [Stemphylium lycopersici]
MTQCETGRKRRIDRYDPSTQEQYPDNNWYRNHEWIIDKVAELCLDLTDPLQKYSADVEGFQEIISAAEAVKMPPEFKQLCLAVLGEQGVGKSSIINSLLDRDLLDNSGSSQACTALATKIMHKKGASDRSTESDVGIEWYCANDIQECTIGQIRCWAELHPGPDAGQRDGDEEDGYGSDEPTATSVGPATSLKAKRQAAATAKEYFGIIFDTQKDKLAKKRLRHMLYKTDIRTGGFLDACCLRAEDRLCQIRKELGLPEGSNKFVHVPDRQLPRMQDKIRKIWPFVKLVSIETGHVLLRHGLCLFDVPGYGDTSHLRTAVINTFRRQADYEMVVVPSSRVATSETHDHYLDMSVHLKGANKTMVVMNKSDALINEQTMFRQIQQIKEEPFISFTERLEYLEEIQDKEEEDPAVIVDEIDALVNSITVAYIKRESDLFRAQLQEKGIKDLFCVSAQTYRTWTKRTGSGSNIPVLTPEQSGIPGLRRRLFLLPAQQNIKAYHDHIFETLPTLRSKAGCVAEKHVEDRSYAEMRLDCKRSIPLLERDLKSLSLAQVDLAITKPWTPSERDKISASIRLLIWRDWVHSKIHFGSFAKMLRERGIPVNGKFKGRNLNADIVTTMENHIDQWEDEMLSKLDRVVESLDAPILKLSSTIANNIKLSNCEAALKLRALEALEDAKRRIASARDTLSEELSDSLQDTRVNFTTEMDIFCPIAKAMKLVYELAQSKSGTGAMEQQRKCIADCITPDPENPKLKPSHPLAKTIENKLVKSQRKWWNVHCGVYIADVVRHLEDFSLTTERLLIDDAYLTEGHRRARMELKKVLADFDKGLKSIQKRFNGDQKDVETASEDVGEPLEKRAKLEQAEDDAAAETTSSSRDTPVDAVPISLAPGWFRATFVGLG